MLFISIYHNIGPEKLKSSLRKTRSYRSLNFTRYFKKIKLDARWYILYSTQELLQPCDFISSANHGCWPLLNRGTCGFLSKAYLIP